MPRVSRNKQKAIPEKAKARPMKEWRRLEAVMVEILLSWDFQLDDNPRTGDKRVISQHHRADRMDLNITAFAQALAERVSMKDDKP